MQRHRRILTAVGLLLAVGLAVMIAVWASIQAVTPLVHTATSAKAASAEGEDPRLSPSRDAPGTQPVAGKRKVYMSIPIASGFVFLDGRYIDSPYIVTRKDGRVYINGRLVFHGIGSKDTGDAPEGDPEMPKGIGKNTSVYDKVFTDYIRRKRGYVQKHHTREEERAIMERVYRSLPFVKEAKVDPRNRGVLHIITFRGESEPWALVSPRRRKVKVAKQAEATMGHLETRLLKGDCYFLSSKGGRISFGREKAATVLPRIVQILRSRKPMEEKFEEIRKAGLPSLTEYFFRSIVTHFQASPQLDERLAKLCAPKGGSSGSEESVREGG